MLPAPRPVLLIEDHPPTLRAMVREVARAELDPIPCHSIKTAREQLRRLAQEHVEPLGMIVDINLPDGSGLDLLEDVRAKHPRMQAIVMSGNLDPHVINRAHLLNAYFALKPATLENLRRFLQQLVAKPQPPLLDAIPRFAATHKLTPREADVLTLIALGVPRAMLARRLRISEESVKTHVKHILRETGDDSVGELVARLLRLAAGDEAPH